MGRVQAVEKVGAGFLQDVGSWIWLPRRVAFELSRDGVNFTTVAEVSAADVSDRDTSVVVKDFVQTIPKRDARFVRVKAYEYGVIPAWHAGAGGASWIFIDEIIVE